MMRATLVAAISSGLALPASAGDLDLMVGLRSVIAAAIRDDGYNCPDVKRMVDLGPDNWGSVLKITCGPVGRDETWTTARSASPPTPRAISRRSPGASSACARAR